MITFPNSPKLQKGAIIGLDPFNPVASVIIFQYNPDTLTRTLTVQAAGAEPGGDPGEALRLKGPPQEQIRLEIEVDAADQLEQADPIAGTMGVYPALSALEMLLYPKSALVIAGNALLNVGTVEAIAPEAPLTLFVWGAKRVLPVRLTSMTITEEAFDPNLNPIRAKVSLELRVLNYRDLGLFSIGGTLFMAHQVAKEVMATIGSTSNLAGVLSGNVRIGGG